MTDSTDSVNNNEVNEDIKKLTVSDTRAQDVLKAIGSESEPTKRSSSKLSNHLTIEAFNAKHSKHSTGSHDIADESIHSQLPQDVVKEHNSTEWRSPQSNSVAENVEATNQNSTPDTYGAMTDLSSMVPECMYSVLQQRAQNVLKMISPESDTRTSDVTPAVDGQEASATPVSNNQNEVSSHQFILEKNNNSGNFKTSYQSSSNLSEMKSSKSNERSLKDKVSSLSASKQPVLKNTSYTTVQHNISQPSEDNTIALPDSKKQNVLTSESEQSNRSTEQCTTNYYTKNMLENVPSTNSKNEVSSPEDNINKAKPISQQWPLHENPVPTNTESINEKLAVAAHNANDAIKNISQIINSDEAPVNLSKKGELIRQLFIQKFLIKLESSGNLDKHSEEVANLTATKFAKWMEDILTEIDTRKKNVLNENQNPNELKQIEEENEEFTSGASAKESVTNKQDLSQTDHDESPEVVKIQELSDSELIEKYSAQLRDSKCELFQFIGPDNVPVEVQHLTNVESKKVMIVKKKTSDAQWSNWVIEVGPDVTLESVSGKVLQSTNNEDEEILMKGSDARLWNLRRLTWENWKPDIFKQNMLQRKIPILKKQCMMTADDLRIEYPSYPFIATSFENSVLHDNINDFS